MNSKERFLEILDFQKPDRCIDWEFAYWGETIKRWYKEGLAEPHGLSRNAEDGDTIGGPGLYWSEDDPWPYAEDVDEHFCFDEGIRRPPVNIWIFPGYETRVVEESERKKEIIDTDGIRKIIMKDRSSMPYWLEWPVKDRSSWERFRGERLNLKKDSLENRILTDKRTMIKNIENSSYPVGFLGYPAGFFGSLRFLIGDVNLFMLYYDDPVLVKDISNYLADFWINCSEEMLSWFNVDAVFFWEDMSGRNGSLISPKMFREFMTPCYRKLIGFLKSRGIKHFIVDTDGKVDELVGLFLETGITGVYPFERQAGNDLLTFRKKYPKLQMMGGFDKNVLTKSKKKIDDELDTVKECLKYGGYIPMADHLIPPNVPFENFEYYRNKIKQIL